MSEQLELQLIVHKVDEFVIAQRSTDGYVNATAMCAAAGKNFASYARLQSTHEFLDELSRDTGIPKNSLAIITRGGLPYTQGTWVHPDVAMHLAQWCAPKFAVAVSRWVREWISGAARPAALPYHIQRYVTNQSQVPPTHFSMLNEMVFAFIAPLENAGYTVPDDMIPDLSTGRMFCKWLRDVKNVDTDAFPQYEHKFADGRIVYPKLYPIELLSEFRMYFHNTWLPKQAPTYFRERDPKALPFLQQVLPPPVAIPPRALPPSRPTTRRLKPKRP